jgi:hypothetical protein
MTADELTKQIVEAVRERDLLIENVNKRIAYLTGRIETLESLRDQLVNAQVAEPVTEE